MVAAQYRMAMQITVAERRRIRRQQEK